MKGVTGTPADDRRRGSFMVVEGGQVLNAQHGGGAGSGGWHTGLDQGRSD